MGRLMILLFLALPLMGQAQDSCHCRRNLDSLHHLVATHYAGFADKVNARSRARFQAHLKALNHAAQTAKSDASCYALLERYTAFFYDKHLMLSSSLPEKTTVRKGPIPRIPFWPDTMVAKAVPARGQAVLPGIWVAGSYRLLFRLAPGRNRLEGVVISSQSPLFPPGSIKFQLTAAGFRQWKGQYFTGEGQAVEVTARWCKDRFYIDQYALYKRENPGPDTLAEAQVEPFFAGIYLEDLDSATAYLKLSSFNPGLKPVLDSLLALHRPWLSRRRHWIIDLTKNGGGSTLTYENLLPWIYTRPYTAPGNRHYLTPGHAVYLKTFLNNYASLLPAVAVAELNDRARQGFERPFAWLSEPVERIQFATVSHFPKQVSILSGPGNASAGEEFLRVAKGISAKAVIFGQPSAGYLDYGDGSTFSLPCVHFEVSIPSRRANYLDKGLAYDRTGFPPDVRIDAAVQDWIEFVQQYWQRRKGLD